MKKFIAGTIFALTVTTGFSLKANVENLQSCQSYKELVSSEKVVVLYHCATYYDLCGCNKNAQVFYAVNELLPDIRFVFVHTCLHPDAREDLESKKVPLVRFYKGGKIVHEITDSSGITIEEVLEAAKKLHY